MDKQQSIDNYVEWAMKQPEAQEKLMEMLMKAIEESVGDKSEYGKRQPGERCMYEIQRMEVGDAKT